MRPEADLTTTPSATPTSGRALFSGNTPLQNLVFLFCVSFGVVLIVSVQAAGDGAWFWYAVLYRSGQHLYSDMHLPLQPLFVLETSTCMALFGKGWLVSKIPAVCQMVAYTAGLYILVRQSNRSDAQKALILACAFFASISFEAYRFDDYHVLADCFQIYSLIALLALQKAATPRRAFVLATLLGVLSGLAITNRLNDGGALLVGVVLGIIALAPYRKLLSTGVFCVVAGLTVLIVVHLTGDSFHAYITSTLSNAVGSKGGAGSVLTHPLQLPVRTLQWLREYSHNQVTFYSLLAALVWTFTVAPFARKRRSWEQIVLAVLGLGLVLFFLHRLYDIGRNALLGILTFVSLAGLAVLFAYVLALWVAARFAWWAIRPSQAHHWDRREILLLIPFGQLLSGSMSSGGTHVGLYGPVTVLFLLLSIFSPVHLKKAWQRDCLFAFAVLALLSTFNFRVRRPFSWHSYVEKPLFTGRTWYDHPVYGPMIIDRDLLQMIQPVCQTIRQDNPNNELLSLPLPFANYFCSVPPWHGYVQTFFDTSTKETIDALMDELQRSPPQWIYYQRQLNNLQLHERAYNQGKPLEQRYLDQLIEQKIARGDWRVVYTNDYGNVEPWDNHWLLIKTR